MSDAPTAGSARLFGAEDLVPHGTYCTQKCLTLLFSHLHYPPRQSGLFRLANAGDREQTRSFTYIDEFVEGTRVASVTSSASVNAGSSELVM